MELRNSSSNYTEGGKIKNNITNTNYPTPVDALVNLTLDELKSATSYDYRFVDEYSGEYAYDSATFPFQQTQQARTKAGVPSAPLDVKVLRDSDGWILKWAQPASDEGEPIQSYAVDYRPDSSSQWQIAERGLTQLYWRIGGSRERRRGTVEGVSTITILTPSSTKITIDFPRRVMGGYLRSGVGWLFEEYEPLPYGVHCF